MRGFLREVVEDLYRRYGDGLSELTVLFPSRRARLFFTDALAEVADRPLWQPSWATVDDLMCEISGLHAGDRMRLIAELYGIYREYHDEPFDKFYFWGDMLLADFDTIDKYLIDADMLFRNISELKELEADVSYLTPEQLRILSSFWTSFGEEKDLSEEKRRFLAIWKTLGPVYRRFRERLTSLQLAYNGMVQRVAAERIAAGEFAFPERRRYVVAGFNALSECEKRLFRFLATHADTDFYWDYDDYYVERPEQEAGMFVRTDIAAFPPRGGVSHDNMRGPKQLTVVSAVSNAVQCKHAASILRDLARREPLGKETAVVLTDENLLMPLLYALPGEAGSVNVTMGYPLRQSLAYSFVERLVELQNHRRGRDGKCAFYHVDVLGLLAHPYVAECDPQLTAGLQERIVADRRISVPASQLRGHAVLERIFVPATTWRERSRYLREVIGEVARMPCENDDARRRVEFLAVLSEEIAKLHNSLEACDIELTSEIYDSLLRRHLQTLRIPFEGEPLEGVQVMGILETRNVDFRNVVILSMNDDNFPGNRMGQSSFVPCNLRAAYALPTPEHHEGVYAYYFYRLIQRAERVYMLYCSHADDKTTGEPSRYIYQLEYESGIPIRHVEAGVDVNLTENLPIEVPKEGSVMQRLQRYLDPDSSATLSPTALFRYVACPLRFYFHSIARLDSDDELSEEVDAPMFGTILHAAAQRLYEPVRGEARPARTLEALVRSGEVERAVTAAVNENCLRDPGATEADYTGDLLLVRDIVAKYLRGGVMRYDMAHDDFTLQEVESEVRCDFPFECGGAVRSVKFAGVADRIDRLPDGTLRVVDYKTGTPHLEFDGLESLFGGTGKQRLSNILQTLLYSMMLHRTRNVEVEPALYYVRVMNRPDFSPRLIDRGSGVKGVRYSLCREEFEERLRGVLGELFDPGRPFTQCEDADTCRYCDFNAVCRR